MGLIKSNNNSAEVERCWRGRRRRLKMYVVPGKRGCGLCMSADKGSKRTPLRCTKRDNAASNKSRLG